jgi:AsmA protein
VAPVVDEALLPIDTLKKLDYDARLTIGQLQASGLVFTEVAIKSTANTGLVKLNNFSAKMYDGDIKAHGQVNVRPATPQLSFQQALNKVNIEPALQALNQIDTVSGLANLNSKLTTKGNSMDSWMRGLNGPVNFNMKQLVVQEINLEHLVCQGIALADGKSMPETTDNTTAIETINGNLLFKDGVLLAQSIKGDMKTLNLKGDGQINPLTEKLDIHLGLRVAGDQVNMDSACRVNSSYRDVYWPVRCKGRFDDEPAKLCDIDKKKLGKISADMAADKLKEKGKKKINKYLDKLFN